MFLRSCLSKVVILALAFGALTTNLLAQQPKVLAPHKPVPPRVENPLPWSKPATLRSMIGGLWMTDANFKSSIYLKNGIGISPLTVTPILYLSNGAKYILPSVTLEPSGTKVVSINDALRDNGIAPWATLVGYLEVQYASFYDPLCALINSVDVVHSLIFTSTLRPAQLPPHVSSTAAQSAHELEGMWWKEEASVSGFVALSNTTAQPVRATVEVSDGEGKLLGQHAATISAHGTKIVNLDEMRWAAASGGGLRIVYDGPEQGLIATGELEDTSSGYSASMPIRLSLTDSEKAGLTSFAELGLMTGAADPMMSFPAGTEFKPFSVLRNISNDPVAVSPSFYWMQGGGARSAQLKSFFVQPGKTTSLDVQSLLSNAGLGNFNGTVNLILDLQGKPHSLLMASGSVDQTKTYVFQVIPRAVGESMSKSISYWSTGNGDDTMVTVWNPADEAQDFIFTLFFSGGRYEVPIHLEPRATRMFNLSEIIQNQIPDSAGNVIPTSIHDGSARIAGTQGEVQSILVAIDAGTYNVRKATCSYYCIWCDGYIDAALGIVPFGVAKSGTKQLNVTALWDFGTQYNLNSQAVWSTNNGGVATVKTGMVTGVAAGSATISGYASVPYYYQYCAYDPTSCPPDYQNSGGSGSGSVANLSCTSSVTRGGTATCTATGASGSTFSNWKFTDASNHTVTSSSTSATWSGVVVTGGTVSVTVTSSGSTATPTAQITVNNRNWHTATPGPVEVLNGTFVVLPVPPQPTGLDSGLGESQETESWPGLSSTFIADSGPNKGYGYYATQLTFTNNYNYEINPDLENTSSTFYSEQCGNYNAQTKPAGFISGSNLLAQTRRHEYNSATQSHYAFYSASLSGSNNPGDYVESRIATPGTSQQTFDNGTSSGIQSNYQNILQAFQVEPFAVNEDATGNFLGNINYSPYATCN